MENTKNHGSQSHTKDSSTDSKKTTNQGHGKSGSQNSANAGGSKVKKDEDDDNASNHSKSGAKNNGSH